ncbi:MAG: pantetheine-phosphate adenylyltransferase, partial [Gemmatimonadetes bacterium]|nr:pantetheine-phosphate adenylyltransferase [Gemmatimonadota bacterium]NIR77390.1 pantetheine-phosphate adenylyltransferase [Gemmatimonadota bacterium]NIT85900.1 pantetheine-phosphate adenylyltransferase [Gemmatimonadota bacterium]NIU29726.1 pantetheine-phosphate adenylyltransferase [Gemmatimonadota bacterium]NIV60134.1 pantetheine-phosphate adenylyltransferase [Gemmatimonadota bacterium]
MSRPGPVVALYPGSFDPLTVGHEDIVRRGLRVADRIIVAVAHTSTHAKKGLFTVEERVELIREVLDDEDRIEAVSFSGLLVDFARERGAHLVVRGLRAVSDFEYELQMAQMNQELWPGIETIFLVPDAQNSF